MQKTITEMKASNKDWFSNGAMEFFNTKIETKPNRLNFFITSERYDESQTRKYSLRWFDSETGDVTTVGAFNELSKKRAKALLSYVMSELKGAEIHDQVRALLRNTKEETFMHYAQ